MMEKQMLYFSIIWITAILWSFVLSGLITLIYAIGLIEVNLLDVFSPVLIAIGLMFCHLVILGLIALILRVYKYIKNI
jgi:hypothetical protein